MDLIIQKIYEENKRKIEEGLKKVLNGEDISVLTGAIKEFTDILGKELIKEIVEQVDTIIFEDEKRKKEYEPVRSQKRKLLTQNGKVEFERRYYEDKENGEHEYLADKVLGIDKKERIDKNVKAKIIRRANDQSYNKSGKEVVPGEEIGVRIDIWTHLTRECIINYVH